MLLPFNKSRRETEHGNLGTVVEAVLGLFGSVGVSSEEPEVGSGTEVVVGLGVDSSEFAVVPSLEGGSIPAFLPLCRIAGEQYPLSCSPGTAIKKCPPGQ